MKCALYAIKEIGATDPRIHGREENTIDPCEVYKPEWHSLRSAPPREKGCLEDNDSNQCGDSVGQNTVSKTHFP